MSERITSEWIEVGLLGSGYAAIHVVEIEDSKIGKYLDVQQTGVGRYHTKEEAIIEAKQWAEADGIKYKDKT